jgi:hypothetical protein
MELLPVSGPVSGYILTPHINSHFGTDAPITLENAR